MKYILLPQYIILVIKRDITGSFSKTSEAPGC